MSIVIVICVFAISACSSYSGEAETGVITISIPGSSQDRIAVTPDQIPDLTHTITFTGPGTINPVTIPPGGGTQHLAVEVPAGAWTVNVRAEGPNVEYDYDFVDPILRALGAATLNVTAGTTTPASIQMISAFEVSNVWQLNVAINQARMDGLEKIIIVRQNIIAGGPFNIDASQNITLVGETPGLGISRGPGFPIGNIFTYTPGTFRIGRQPLGAMTFSILLIDGAPPPPADPYADFILGGFAPGVYDIITGLVPNPSSLDITIPASIITISDHAFENTLITSVSFAPNSVLMEIGSNAFSGTTSLINVVAIPSTVNTIGMEAFADSSVQTITFAPPLPSQWAPLGIGRLAFAGSTQLSITIPDRVIAMGDDVFRGWAAPQTITVPFADLVDADAAFWGGGWRGEDTPDEIDEDIILFAP